MNEPAPTLTPQPSPKNRGWRLAFMVLLALNLGVAGVVGGLALRYDGPHGGMVRDLGFGPFNAALGPQDRAALRSAFLAKVPEWRDMRRAMREDTTVLLAALRAEPFDPEALSDAIKSQQSRNQMRLELGQQLILERILMMSAEERAGFADRLEQAMSRRPGAEPRP
jgi:uncharacterized membrane protein